MVPALILAALVALLYRAAMQIIAAASSADSAQDRAMPATADGFLASTICVWGQTRGALVDQCTGLTRAARTDSRPRKMPKISLTPIKHCNQLAAEHFIRLTG